MKKKFHSHSRESFITLPGSHFITFLCQNSDSLEYHAFRSTQTLLPRHHRFTFTGKERDEETGFSYFGARYYDSDISGLFLSVDPMADKYPSLSPYAYCAWNPIKAIDPDGKDSIVSIDLKTGYSSFNTSEESIGRQIVEYTQNGKVIDIYSCLGTIAVSQNNETNSIIEFSMASDANNVSGQTHQI